MRAVFILLAISLLCCVQADICDEVQNPDTKFKPNFFKDFTVDIEVVKQGGSTVQNLRMYYSSMNKIIRLDSLEDEVKTSTFYNFIENDILIFDFSKGRGECTVKDLRSSVDDFLLGGVSKGTGQAAFPLPLAALHFSGKSGLQDHQIKRKNQGTQQIRGKDAVAYSSCQKWTGAKNNIVLKVTHYFAADSLVFPYNGMQSKSSNLLSMDLEGTGTVNGVNNVHIKHKYNFFNLRPGIEKEQKLETPDGIVCPNRKTALPFPKLPNHIRYSSETINHFDREVTQTEEIYLFKQGFYINNDQPKANTDKDINRLTKVYDFNADIVYRLDNTIGDCRRSNLADIKGKDLSFMKVVNGTAKMKDPASFFMADAKDFAYLGKKMTRGVQADVWVANTAALPQLPNAVVEWRFAPETHSWNSEYSWSTHPMPMKLSLWVDRTSKKYATQNIFRVDYNKPRSNLFDLSPCFDTNVHFQVVLTGSRTDVIRTGKETVLEEIVYYVQKAAIVDLTQINGVKLYYSNDDVIVEFLLGGNSDMKKETKRVTDSVKAGKFQIQVLKKNKKDVKTLHEDKVTSHEVKKGALKSLNHGQWLSPPKKSGYGAGAMAGTAIGMVILGIAGGTAAGFAHRRYTL